MRKLTSHPIVELGELETTFSKTAQGDLKNFLSNTMDMYRLPYARNEIMVPRTTSFGASVNRIQILRDTTGSRRFWPIALSGAMIPRVAGLEQLWAQALYLWRSGVSFHLTAEEEQMQQAFSDQHMDTDEATELMAEKFPNGFITIPRGQDGQDMNALLDATRGIVENDMMTGARLISVTDIKHYFGLKGAMHNDSIRDYVTNHGGKFARHTDQHGVRHAHTCVAAPSNGTSFKLFKRAMSQKQTARTLTVIEGEEE